MTKFNKSVFLVVGIIIFLVRLTGDILLYSLDITKSSTIYPWNFITSFAIIASFAIYYFYNFIESSKDKSNEDYGNNFLNSIYQNFILSFIIVILIIFFSFKDTASIFKKSYIGLIIYDLFYLYVVIVSLINFQFTFRWLWNFRHKLTKFYTAVIGLMTVIILISSSVLSQSNILNTWANILTTLSYITLIVVSFFMNKKNNWIANISRSLKTQFFWIFIINILLAIKIIDESLKENSLIFATFNELFPYAQELLIISFIIYGIYILKLFMKLLAVLPSSVIVDRKSTELNSLTYLNRIILETANNSKNQLINTVTNLAIQASSAYGAWGEIYNDDDAVLVVSCVNINPKDVADIHNKFGLNKFLNSFTEVQLIESVREVKELSFLINNLPLVKSLIIVPLYSSAKREGTLVVFDSEEFSMEQYDLNILKAFSDNITIALENSRLLNESIEKERFRSEMLLARTMQQKLLPQKLPEIKDYTISAFSIPATEVGGDYYDIMKLKNGDTCIIIGDVSGKGMTAAFYMAQLKGVVLSKAAESDCGSDLLSKINSVLYKNMESQMFITMATITISQKDGNICLSRAGHMPFLLKRSNSIEKLIPRGIGIGLVKDEIFNQNIEKLDISINSGDSLIMFTDGLNEVRNNSGTEFGFEKLSEFIREIEFTNAKSCTKLVLDKINEFTGDTAHHDDMTFITISKL